MDHATHSPPKHPAQQERHSHERIPRVTARRHLNTDQLVGHVRSVGAGCVDVGDPEIGGLAQDSECAVVVGRGSSTPAQGPQPGSLAEPFETLVELQQQGLVRHLGVSNVTAEQAAEAQAIAPIVCVQNFYNLAYRQDDELTDELADRNIAYVPFFPLGGFTPVQSTALSAVATRLDATPMSVALARLLRRSPNILLLPGTSSLSHLRENVDGAGLSLSDDGLAELDEIGPVRGEKTRCGGGCGSRSGSREP